MWVYLVGLSRCYRQNKRSYIRATIISYPFWPKIEMRIFLGLLNPVNTREPTLITRKKNRETKLGIFYMFESHPNFLSDRAQILGCPILEN